MPTKAKTTRHTKKIVQKKAVKKSLHTYDIVTVGSALRDVTFFSDQMQVLKNPSTDPTCKELIAFEFGAKIKSERVEFHFGGGAVNAGLTTSALGLHAGMFASVGMDDDGDSLALAVSKRGVDTSLVRKSTTQHTGFSFIPVHSKTGDRSVFVYYGASMELPATPTQIHTLDTAWLYVSSLNSSQWEKFFELLVAHPSKIAWNPGGKQFQASARVLRKFLAHVDVLIVNRDEATELGMKLGVIKKTEAVNLTLPIFAERLQDVGPDIVVVTDGHHGASVADWEHSYFHKTPQDKPLDTTGAGDCYGSTFVTGLIRFDGNIEAAMDLAQLNTSSLVQQIGSNNGLLEWKDVPRRFHALTKRATK